MPLSKQPLEVSLGGAVEEGNVKELVQPPRIREAKDCASLKGGAYTKRDQLLTPGAVDPTTQGASHTDDALVTVASDNTVRVYPDDGTDPSSSNPAPFTVSRLEAFEPTEADAVKSHGDSATHIVDGVPRTLSMWNTDFDGAYVAASCENNLGTDPTPSNRWVGKDVGAPTISRGARNAWWTYLATNGVRFAVFDNDRQVGSEQDYPAPPRIASPSGEPGSDICALGKPTAPRVRAFEAPAAVGDPTQFFVSCAALTTPQKCRMTDATSTDPPPGWENSVYGSRLSTFCSEQYNPAEPYVGGMPPVPTSTRDIMERNGYALGALYPANEGAYNAPDPGDVTRRQGPGMVLSLHDLDGNILESVRGDVGMVRPAVPDPATNPNANLMLPGPPLEMVVVDVDGTPSAYTLHVDYAQRFPYQGYPDPVAGYATGPYPAPGTDHPDRNTIRIIRWDLLPNNPAGSRIQFVNEVYFNDPNWVNPATGPADGVVWENQVPDWAGAPADEGMRDWPAGLHDVGNQQLMLVFSSTRIALVPYNLDPATTTYKPPFWENGYLTRLKIGRMTGDPGIQTPVWPDPGTPDDGPIAPEYAGLHYDMFERHCTGFFTLPDVDYNRMTTQMTRGAWAGSFLSGPDGDGRWWLGVQTIADTDNVDNWLLPGGRFGGTGTPLPPNGVHPYQYLWGPQTYSGSVVHTLLDESFDALDQESSCIPGCTIASQGLYAVTPNWSGHSVALYASAPGDDRTGQQEIGALTRSDVFSSTAFLAVRRNLRRPTGEVATQQGQQRLAPLDRQGNQYPASSAYVTAVAIVQALPFGQALDTYQANPYQCRVNLRQDGDRLIRWTAFQRYATTESFGSGAIDKDLRSLKVTGSSSRSAPYEMTYLPSPDGPRISPQMIPQHGYVTIAGAAPTVVGGPQGFLAGMALQAVVDNFVAYAVPTAAFYDYQHRPINEAIPLPDYTAAKLDPVDPVPPLPVPPPPTALNVGSFLTVFDEQGGQHRTVPHTTSLGYAYTYNNVGWPDLDSIAMEAILYGVPWQLAGISLADEASVEVAVGRADEGDVPLSVAVPSPPFVTHEHQLVSGSATAAEQAVVVAPSGVSNTVPLDYRSTFGAGSGGALYTWSGELGADAPDPSRSVAAASNRLWSISSVDPRKAQYTKLLRKGYAPEWNQNLTVRVPGTADPLTAVAALPDGRILLFSSTAIHYTYGSGPSDTGQGAGFAEPAYLSTDIGCTDPRSIVTGDFGCIFLSERGFYLIDRKLTVSFVGLPYEDTTDIAGLRLKGTASDALRSEVLFFTDRIEEDTTGYQTWVFNTLRGQWSTFVMPEALSVTERDGRPFWITQNGTLRARFDEEPATINGNQGVMSLTTGWLPMAKVQGYGRTWELQITGERPLTAAGYSQSGLKVELLYDYDETPAETYFFNQPAEAGGANIKLRLRPRKQKSEALSVRFSEYAPPGIPPDQPFTGWRLDMLTVLVGIKVGLDKVPTTPRDNT